MNKDDFELIAIAFWLVFLAILGVSLLAVLIAYLYYRLKNLK